MVNKSNFGISRFQEFEKLLENTFFLQNFTYTLRKGVLFSVWIQVQYRKSVKNVTLSRTNHDLFLQKDSNKEHF
jgi:hypothetical protein